MYCSIYKSGKEIFCKVPKIDLGEIILRGILWGKLELEAHYYYLCSYDEMVKKYLPGAYVSGEDEAAKMLLNYQERFFLRNSFLFCVTTRELRPIGYVLCNSPLVTYINADEPINDWTIDFWLNKQYRGKGIATSAVYNTCVYLQKMSVPQVFAFVNKSNEKSIKLLKNINMNLLEETYDKQMYKFGVRL